ncbi:hypothetical protein QVD17_07257 [Tagetes erecta]|uniref:Uncharacterized protein n=1 Tax=Tagetes erecta TaxID=13708 RepID=A0AAD8LHG6_TARER|nr:hypothetical protein QVD17_07257 [Tagetes erecta]
MPDQGSADVAFRTPLAPYEKSKFLGSGGSMVARLKLKGIDGRAPPGVCDALRCSGPHARYTDVFNEYIALADRPGKSLKFHRDGDRSLQLLVLNEEFLSGEASSVADRAQVPWKGAPERCEHACRDLKDGELCLSGAKPEETLVEARSDTDVQIVRLTWVGRCGHFVEPYHGIESSKWAIFGKQNWRCGMNRKPGYGAKLRANLEPTKGVGRLRQQDGGHGSRNPLRSV